MVVDAAAQEGLGQLFFRIAGDDDDRGEGPIGLEALAQFVHGEFQVLDLVQEVVGEIPGRLVHLVDEDQGALGLVVHGLGARLGTDAAGHLGRVQGAQDGLPQGLDAQEFPGFRQGLPGRRVELGLGELADAVELVEQLAGLAGGFGVEAQHRAQAQFGGQAVGQLGLAGARFAGDQQGHVQAQGHVHRAGQFRAGPIAVGVAQGRLLILAGGLVAGNVAPALEALECHGLTS